MKIVLTTLGNYILYILASILPFILSIVNVICQIIISCKRTSTLLVASHRAKKDAVDIDIFFNYAFDDVWKLCLIKKKYWHEIGKEGETLSYLIARGWRDKYLRRFGYVIGVTINIFAFLEYSKGGHLRNTIKKYEK